VNDLEARKIKGTTTHHLKTEIAAGTGSKKVTFQSGAHDGQSTRRKRSLDSEEIGKRPVLGKQSIGFGENSVVLKPFTAAKAVPKSQFL